MGRVKDIEANILKILGSSNNPVSTREISLKIKMAWHTVDRHCLKLELKQQVKSFRIGNINAWVINR